MLIGRSNILDILFGKIFDVFQVLIRDYSIKVISSDCVKKFIFGYGILNDCRMFVDARLNHFNVESFINPFFWNTCLMRDRLYTRSIRFHMDVI